MAPPTHSVPVIGLIGGIGSGKTAIARWVAQRRNTPVIDGDAIGHQALTLPETRTRIQEQFGTEVFDEAGLVDRSALAKLVFGPDDSHRRARRKLEDIVHPVIRREITETIETLRTCEPQPEAILLDAAVLLEAGWENVCDAVVFIDTPEAMRRGHVASRGWSADELRKREASQLSLSEKESRADFVITNDADLEQVARQLEEFMTRIPRRGV